MSWAVSTSFSVDRLQPLAGDGLVHMQQDELLKPFVFARQPLKLRHRSPVALQCLADALAIALGYRAIITLAVPLIRPVDCRPVIEVRGLLLGGEFLVV